MIIRQVMTAAVMSLALIVVILELVRRGKLKEEHSWIWILGGLATLVLAVWYDFLEIISRLIGSDNRGAVFLFLGLVFLALVNLHSATKISSLSEKTRILAQEIALLKSKANEED